MKVQINCKNRLEGRQLVNAQLIKVNTHTVIVKLADGHHTKRKVVRDVDPSEIML